MLAFSRRQVLRFAPVDVNELVTELLQLTGPMLGANIAVEHLLTPLLPAVDADRTQLEQALLNLVMNARDAMPRGGRLTIATGLAGATAVEIKVHDTGVGMDAATRARLFDPFFSTKLPDGGAGLGLATVHGIVAQRLVRRVCDNCAQPTEPNPQQRAWLHSQLDAMRIAEMKFQLGVGCTYCNLTGYRGRTAIYELLEIDRPLADAVRRGDAMEFAEIVRRRDSFVTLAKAALALASSWPESREPRWARPIV